MAGVDDELRFVQEFVEGLDKLERKLTEDVKDVCKVIVRLDGECRRLRMPEASKIPLKKHFRDIYCSLRFHMMFHLGLDLQELRKLGKLELVQLTDEQMDQFPDLSWAIDPGSKILEIVSTVF